MEHLGRLQVVDHGVDERACDVRVQDLLVARAAAEGGLRTRATRAGMGDNIVYA